MTNLNIYESPIRIDLVFGQNARKESFVVVKNHQQTLLEGTPGECVTKIRRIVHELALTLKNPHIVFYLQTTGDEYPYCDYDIAEMKSRLMMISVANKCRIEVRTKVNTRF